jgi:subtilisin family serine protease
MGGLDLRLVNRVGIAVLAALTLVGPAQAARDPEAAVAWPGGTAVVSYESEAALRAALARHPARVVRRVAPLRVAAVRPAGDIGAYAARIGAEPGIRGVERAATRRSLAEPALALDASSLPFQWQYSAIGADRVPADVAAAAAGITIAVVDTGADVTAPDLGSKQPHAYSIRHRSADVADANGHGTFVAALAAGSATNGDGIAGVAGAAGLMVVQAGAPDGSFTDVDEAAAIVYAVDRGAKIVNLSLGGPETSVTERRAVDYAVSKGALLVAAAGNGGRRGNAVEYPAALLQPVGSNGVGGRGLSVAASDRAGARAAFSSSGSHVSLAAPGASVFSAVASTSSEARYPRTALPGSVGGLYGYASGTSFAAPQIAGAAALVWAANPRLGAADVATILEQTAGGAGSWTAGLGFGVVDVAAAVERARTAVPGPVAFTPPAAPAALPFTAHRMGRRVTLTWRAVDGATVYRVHARTKGKSRLLRVSRRTATTVALARGTHELRVSALDLAGTAVAVSRPYRVQIPR